MPCCWALFSHSSIYSPILLGKLHGWLSVVRSVAFRNVSLAGSIPCLEVCLGSLFDSLLSFGFLFQNHTFVNLRRGPAYGHSVCACVTEWSGAIFHVIASSNTSKSTLLWYSLDLFTLSTHNTIIIWNSTKLLTKRTDMFYLALAWHLCKMAGKRRACAHLSFGSIIRFFLLIVC